MGTRSTARTATQVALLLVLVVGGAAVVFARFVREPGTARVEPPRPAPPAAPRAEDEAIVEAISGPVQRSSAAGEWRPLDVGDRLRADDSLRTGKGGRTDLRIGSRARLTVAESTQLGIREITEKVHSFRLQRGRISADYKADGARVLRIENQETGVVAETGAARFSVLSTGTSVAIATDEGAVRLQAGGKTVEVGSGQQTVARKGGQPAEPAPIPAALLLKVAAAGAAAAAPELCADVNGTAPPGAEVSIDGRPVDVSADGRFSQRVPKAPGRERVLLAVRDATGRAETRTIPCAGERPSAIKDFAIKWRQRGTQ